ncbi:glycosyltransferase [Litchfieldia salsa]|uniref:Glycosyl transferase family 2 n=1 Tax=Litchfieldia salsa TaxID=930152 RepID=A0A1H0ST37_9BACI|nr:glycosyltransferase family A protein [Litchfieldia salsa]SDP44947.1 Glycosyl transferase family 2 [Litchfieldia salsa]
MISVITCTNRQPFIHNLFSNYLSQHLEEKELIIVLNGDQLDYRLYKEKSMNHKNITIIQVDEKMSLGECLNLAVSIASYDYIAKFDDDDYYSPFYLLEAMDSVKKTNAKVIGKSSIYIYFKGEQTLGLYNPNQDNRYIDISTLLMGATLLIEKKLLMKIPFPDRNLGEDTYFQLQCLSEQVPIYSTSTYHYAYIRYNTPLHHTSDSTNVRLMRKCQRLRQTIDYKKVVRHEN